MYTANDNGPAQLSAAQSALGGGDSIGHHMEARDRATAYDAEYLSPAYQASHTPHPKRRGGGGTSGGNRGGNGGGDGYVRTRQKSHSPISFFLSFCIWVGAMAAAFVYFQEYSNPLIRILICVGVGWSALLLAYVSMRQGRDFFRDLGLSGLLAASAGAAFVVMQSYNMPINLQFLMIGAAILTVLLANVLKERYFLTVSAMAALSWTALSVSSLQISPLYWVFPTVWIMQMVLSIEMRAKLPLVLATLSGLIWALGQLFILTAQAQISTLMAICTLFALGITYSRVGKSMQERHVLSGLFQTNLGWAIAAISALLLQDYWMMDTPHAPWNSVSAPAVTSYPLMAQWGVFILLCLGTLGLYSLFRLRVRHDSFRDTFIGGGFWGGLGLVGFAALLPASVAFNTQFSNLLNHYGFSATPNVGLLIGGGITALSLGMLASGYQRGKFSMILMAVLTLCAEAILVMERLYTDPDNMFVFGFAILVIALTSWLYTRSAENKTMHAAHTVHPTNPEVANA